MAGRLGIFFFKFTFILNPSQKLNTKLGHFKKLSSVSSFLKCPNFVFIICKGLKILIFSKIFSCPITLVSQDYLTNHFIQQQKLDVRILLKATVLMKNISLAFTVFFVSFVSGFPGLIDQSILPNNVRCLEIVEGNGFYDKFKYG